MGILFFQEIIIEGGPFIYQVCNSIYPKGKASSRWYRTLDAKPEKKDCTDLQPEKALYSARRLRKALYPLLPLFSLKSWLYNAPGTKDLRDWLRQSREWTVAEENSQWLLLY